MSAKMKTGAVFLALAILTLSTKGAHTAAFADNSNPKHGVTKPARNKTGVKKTIAKKPYIKKSQPPSCPSDFVLIPSGAFMMGSPDSEKFRDPGEVQHKVIITRNFCMGKYPVTQAGWKRVMGNNPSYFKACGADCPVENVSWNDAQAFITKYNAAHGGGYRLPTEAEWEYAARARTATAFYTGDISEPRCKPASAIQLAGWYCGNSAVTYASCVDTSRWGGVTCGGTHPVGKKEPNAWGLYDMSGNVWVWTQDLWQDGSTADTAVDPVGPATGTMRVARGGGWVSFALYCRSANRYRTRPENKYYYLGLRLAKTFP